MLFDTTQLALERSISGAAQRQEALAANIANADTPGYRRVDVDFHGALAAALGSSDAELRARAHRLHDPGRSPRVGATQADGNSIDIDAESAKLAANALDQQAAVSGRQDPQRDPALAMGVG